MLKINSTISRRIVNWITRGKGWISRELKRPLLTRHHWQDYLQPRTTPRTLAFVGIDCAVLSLQMAFYGCLFANTRLIWQAWRRYWLVLVWRGRRQGMNGCNLNLHLLQNWCNDPHAHQTIGPLCVSTEISCDGRQMSYRINETAMSERTVCCLCWCSSGLRRSFSCVLREVVRVSMKRRQVWRIYNAASCHRGAIRVPRKMALRL